MARLSREFVKLETRVLNDYRFFRMDEFGQLTYIKLLGIARATQNKIPKNLSVIRDLLRTNRDETEIESALKQIKENFPKFKQNKYFYYFEEYELRLNNYVPNSENNSCVDKEEDEDKDKEKEEDTLISYWNATLTTPKLLEKEFIGELLKKFGFQKSKLLIRQFKEGNFHSLRTMRESLNEDGTIKPRSENSPESKKHYKTTAELKKELYG